MALHLLKLCVGADSIRDLEDWIKARLALASLHGHVPEHIHTTRMMPRRAEELLDGGSLFWVIKGQVAARQKLEAIRPFTDPQGIGRCELVMQTDVIPVWPRPGRPFQGWRYLKPEEAPEDFAKKIGESPDMPDTLRVELREMGLL